MVSLNFSFERKSNEFSSPNCRCEISKSNCTRNLAVEKTISELPIQCDHCLQIFLRSEIKGHQSQTCPDRFVDLLDLLRIFLLSLLIDQQYAIIPCWVALGTDHFMHYHHISMFVNIPRKMVWN